jgi:hypothetical protein
MMKTIQEVVQVTSLELGLADDGESNFLGFVILNLTTQTDLLQLENNVGHVLDNSGERGELVVDTLDVHRCNCEALQGREEDTTQRIADGDAIAGFQRTELKGATEIISLEHDHLVGFLER